MRALFPLAILLALAAPGSAAECVPGTSPTAASQAGLYVAVDDCVPLCLSVFVYQESNGIRGLQRDDEGRDDTCGGAIKPDTLIV